MFTVYNYVLLAHGVCTVYECIYMKEKRYIIEGMLGKIGKERVSTSTGIYKCGNVIEDSSI